jgi:hypothetical protein
VRLVHAGSRSGVPLTEGGGERVRHDGRLMDDPITEREPLVVTVAADNAPEARPAGLALLARRLTAAALAGVVGLLAVGCGRSGAVSIDHGVVIGHLVIPFAPAATRGGGAADVIKVTVAAGQRLSVEVDTSDGPAWWSQTGAKPDASIVKVVGDYNIGSCPANQVGCRVPYYHTLLARGPGTATMTWRYNSAACNAPASSPLSKQCPKVRDVQFDIRVR